MNVKQFSLAIFVAALSLGILPARADDAAAAVPTTNTLVIHADQGKTTISRNIYGQFSEHLGRCVSEGIWVGEDSPIPNTRGIRNDVVAALKKLQVPVLRWPGGCFADQYHWMDGVGPRGPAAQTHQHHLGRRGGGQPFRHARVSGFLRSNRRRALTSAATSAAARSRSWRSGLNT